MPLAICFPRGLPSGRRGLGRTVGPRSRHVNAALFALDRRRTYLASRGMGAPPGRDWVRCHFVQALRQRLPSYSSPFPFTELRIMPKKSVRPSPPPPPPAADSSRGHGGKRKSTLGTSYIGTRPGDPAPPPTSAAISAGTSASLHGSVPSPPPPPPSVPAEILYLPLVPGSNSFFLVMPPSSNDDDTVTSSQMSEWAEEDAVKDWTRVVKLLIIQEWVRGCLFVVRWWDQRLPLGD